MPETREEIHVAGVPVQVGTRLRQRCSWCGAVIDDTELAGLATVLHPGQTEPDPYPSWQVGALIARSGGATYVIDHEPGEVLPAGCCAKLDPDVTA